MFVGSSQIYATSRQVGIRPSKRYPPGNDEES